VTQTELSLDVRIELAVAVAVVIVFLIASLINARARHLDVAPWHVHLGAAIYGVLIGAVIGFVVVPLRAVLMNGELAPHNAALSGFGVLAIMISIRRGLIGRLPFLGPQVRAFRRANLRRTIETAQKQLDQLTAKDAGRGS
jgi:hypothetical protein